MQNYINVLKKYVVFSGRSTRTEFWMFTLVNTVISILIQIIGSVVFGKDSIFVMVVSVFYMLATLIPTIAVNVRRLHDTGRSGKWMFIGLVPFAGGIALLVFALLDSESGDNRFGPNPKGQSVVTPPVVPTPAV